jgi:RimJ/RimL family protein N-acetyltransferase
LVLQNTAGYDGLEIGYHLFDANSRNKGLMTESLSLLVRFLFAIKKINRLQLTVMVPNIASRRVAEKCGFKLEGIARGALSHKGQNHDVEMYSSLRQEVSLT